jgi:hypothetical protein
MQFNFTRFTLVNVYSYRYLIVIHSVSNNCAYSPQGIVWAVPVLEEIFYGFRDLMKGAEITIVQTQPPDQLPDPLNGIEVRAVRRQEIKLKAADSLCPPVAVELGVMVFGVVRDDRHAAPGCGYWCAPGS